MTTNVDVEKLPGGDDPVTVGDNNTLAASLSPAAVAPRDQENTLLAWTQVLVGFLLMFSSWGLVNTFGVFQDYYTLVPSFATSFAVSWIGSVQSFLLLLLGALSGRVVDAGYARSMTAAGSFLIVFGMMMVSLSGNGTDKEGEGATLVYYQIMLSQGICCGAGMGLVFIPSISITATYFQRRRALALGIVTTGAAAGGVVYPVVFEHLIESLEFRWTVRIIALLALATLGVACLLIRPRTDLPTKKKAPLLEILAFKEPAYLALVLGQMSSFAGVYVVYFFILGRVSARNVDLQALRPYYLVSFLNIGGVFGRIVPNYLADKYVVTQNSILPSPVNEYARTHPLLIQSIFVFIGGILIFVWPVVLNLAGLIIFCLVYGFFSGAFISLPPASVASVTKDMSRYGARLGMAVTCNAFGLLAGPPIASAIIFHGPGYTGTSLFGGFIVVAGSALIGSAWFFNVREARKSGS
ncbi:riboflavin transporter MCH5 [Diplocarpon rosae]|nr:riboflavin transporter MCH5 [Diplocarpon rosae]